ncbi:hypothetical protein [Clostridium sp. UBA4548]|uniref:hypothetical protein n=1 Tax=Clostridium sp. UBA4548 TaxID=1946361 RepID=UPI0025B936BC|nr:hypothetical protein [Clostridium sp. UBA4548]
MAGYIFSLDSINSLRQCIENGVYSTNLTSPRNNTWGVHHEGTFADYLSMKPGDNVYFFIKRKIYGIGKLISIKNECKLLNFPNALQPNNFNNEEINDEMLMKDCNGNTNNRILCIFEPSPNFFLEGIDMDDVLSSNPNSFKNLRAFWKLSFIKVDDNENKALKDIILIRNEQSINRKHDVYNFNTEIHNGISTKVSNNYFVNEKAILMYSHKEGKIKHEMAIEAAITSMVSRSNNTIFGRWDYISHQVIASPFKAIDYMDKMDIFGYRYISGFDTISKYLVLEIKKDEAVFDAIDQVIKYVDWLSQEYTFGNYEMIEAFIVAYDFSKEVIAYKNNVAIRNFTIGRRPIISKVWTNLRLVKYKYNIENSELEFEEVN